MNAASLEVLKTKIIAALAAKKITAVARPDGSLDVQDGSYGVLHFNASEYVGPTRTVRVSVCKLVMRIVNDHRSVSP